MKDKKVWASGLCGALFGAAAMFLAVWVKPEIAPSTHPKKAPANVQNPLISGQQSTQNPLARAFQDEEEDFPGFGFFGQLPQIANMVVSGPELEEREDDANLYYDLKFSGQDGSKVEASVEGNQVVVSGVMKNSSSRGIANMVSESSFQRIFPVPPGVDGSRMEILNEPGKVTLKFPKVR